MELSDGADARKTLGRGGRGPLEAAKPRAENSMRVIMRTRFASVSGQVVAPGAIATVDKAEGKALVDGGWARLAPRKTAEE